MSRLRGRASTCNPESSSRSPSYRRLRSVWSRGDADRVIETCVALRTLSFALELRLRSPLTSCQQRGRKAEKRVRVGFGLPPVGDLFSLRCGWVPDCLLSSLVSVARRAAQSPSRCAAKAHSRRGNQPLDTEAAAVRSWPSSVVSVWRAHEPGHDGIYEARRDVCLACTPSRRTRSPVSSSSGDADLVLRWVIWPGRSYEVGSSRLAVRCW
jgi:hypothetical protein